MALPRLLLSHSTATDPVARPIIDGLETALKGRFSILLDRSTLPAGDNWRNTLNVWTGTCDAAVALITPTSIASEFCKYEWSILGFRRSLDAKFPVIPLYFGSTPADLANAPHQFGAIQGHDHIDLPTSVNKILTLLKPVKHRAGQTPAELHAQYVASRLKAYVNDLGALDRASNRVNVVASSWDPTADEWLRLAMRLIGADMSAARAALDEIVPYFKNDESAFYELLDLVACSWVDLAAERTIQKRAQAAAPPRDVALNAARTDTARLCVLRASGKPPSNAWRVAEVPHVFERVDQLIDQIYISLAPLFNMAPPVDRQKLQTKLARERKYNEPVIVALREDGLDASFLTALRTEFPTVMFFLLTAQRPVAAGTYTDVEFITPPLSGRFESDFWETYNDAKEFFEDKPAVFKRA